MQVLIALLACFLILVTHGSNFSLLALLLPLIIFMMVLIWTVAGAYVWCKKFLANTLEVS